MLDVGDLNDLHDHTFNTFSFASRFKKTFPREIYTVCMCMYDICVFTQELMKLWKVCVGRLTVGDGALRLCLGH